jgi:hypothetical protein
MTLALAKEKATAALSQSTDGRSEDEGDSTHRLNARIASISACQSCNTIPFADRRDVAGRQPMPVLRRPFLQHLLVRIRPISSPQGNTSQVGTFITTAYNDATERHPLVRILPISRFT